MNEPNDNVGWQFHHHDQLQYRTTGSPTFLIKFYQYPSYRQKVTIAQPPTNCKLKTKGLNSFFVFNQKVHSRGMLSFERKIIIEPKIAMVNHNSDWGEIQSIPADKKQKYRESSKYWPSYSSKIKEITESNWFYDNSLSNWVKRASIFVLSTITSRENQETRLGAQQALLKGVGDCDEFTDLFITLARMRGIPSRRLTGYYITDHGKNVEAHAWAEIFSPTVSWIPVDLAMNNIGAYTQNYVIWKVEEFNPALPD